MTNLVFLLEDEDLDRHAFELIFKELDLKVAASTNVQDAKN